MGLGGRRGALAAGGGRALSAALEHGGTGAPTGRRGLGAPRGVGGAMLHIPFLGGGGIAETLALRYGADAEGAPGKWWGAR